METVRLNVGGTIFETTRSTLNAVSCWKLSDQSTLQSHYRETENDYFFDRDPVVFGVILNFLRTSELHLPNLRCGPSIKMELDYWQVDEQHVQRCCWTSYNKWHSTLEALARLERDQKAFAGGFSGPDQASDNTWWAQHRAKVWQFLNRSNSSLGAKIFGIISLLFVVVSITTLILSTTSFFENNDDDPSPPATTTSPTSSTTSNIVTCPPLTPDETINEEKYHKNKYLDAIDIVCLSYFLLEYIIRLIYSPRKLHFIISFLSIVDLVALIPDIIDSIVLNIGPDILLSVGAINFVTILRVLRIFRIFRLVRHSTGLWVLIYTLKASISELLLLVWLMAIGIVFFASLIHVVEDKRDFYSIPEGFWWAIITMTTVGYGDMSPKTPWGKVIGSFCAMLGVLVIGFSVPSLVNNFMMYYNQMEFATMMEQKEKAKLNGRAEEEKSEPNDNSDKENDKSENNNTVPFEILTTELKEEKIEENDNSENETDKSENNEKEPFEILTTEL